MRRSRTLAPFDVRWLTLFASAWLIAAAAVALAQQPPSTVGPPAVAKSQDVLTISPTADTPAAAATPTQEPATAPAAPRTPPVQPADTETVKLFRMQSPLLTKFWGRPMFMEAGVVLPPDYKDSERPPVCYNIHGFGSSHRVAWRSGPRLVEKITQEDYPRMLYVFLNGQFSLGHHEFMDSVNNGPWGEALTTEFIPALEKHFHAYNTPQARFVMGHSSGGWSSLWLQTYYPEFFGGTWSSSPDPVDFREFTGVNIYEQKNMYVSGAGQEVLFIRNGDEYRSTLKKYSQDEFARRDHGGQMASFDATFSPRAEDGRPAKLYDRASGEIDPKIAESWKQFDISLRLREQWSTLGPKLNGKLHIFCGTRDTFRLNEAVALLENELKKLGSDAQIVWIEGRGHSIGAADPTLWPKGLDDRMHREMWSAFESKTSQQPALQTASGQ